MESSGASVAADEFAAEPTAMARVFVEVVLKSANKREIAYTRQHAFRLTTRIKGIHVPAGPT